MIGSEVCSVWAKSPPRAEPERLGRAGRAALLDHELWVVGRGRSRGGQRPVDVLLGLVAVARQLEADQDGPAVGRAQRRAGDGPCHGERGLDVGDRWQPPETADKVGHRRGDSRLVRRGACPGLDKDFLSVVVGEGVLEDAERLARLAVAHLGIGEVALADQSPDYVRTDHEHQPGEDGLAPVPGAPGPGRRGQVP